MNIFGRKKKQTAEVKTEQVEAKSCGTPAHATYIFNTFGSGIGSSYLAPQSAYQMYHKIGPLQSTVVKVSDAVSDLPIVLRSETEPEDITKDSDVLDLINNPSPITTKKQFLSDCATSVMITKELWIVARGFLNGLPEELAFVHPYNIQIIEDPEHQWPAQVYVNVNGDRRRYYREEWHGRYRYIDKTRLNEIFPYIKGRNVSGTSGYFRGISPLSSVKDELLSYSASVVSNTATIENGARPSGIVSPKDNNMTEKQWEDLQESMNDVTGAGNAGKVALLPTPIEAAFPQWAPKDMDYDTLQKNVKMNIWNLYNIPFPMVSETNQSYNNTETAELSFYDNSVNSVWSDVADALKWALITRFDLEGFSISYNQFEVPALRRRAIRMMKEMVDSPLEINEIRNSGGFEDTANGDAILVNSGKSTLSAVVDGSTFESDGGEGNSGNSTDDAGGLSD